jgi:hypothetical protein
MRAVEFLTEAYKALFSRNLHQVFLDTKLYNSLLYFFDHYPFHNILHQKVSELFMTLLDKLTNDDDDLINSILYDTNLLRKILDTSRDGGIFTFQSTGLTLNRGHLPFVRRLANKLMTL